MSDGKQSRRTVLKGAAASWGLNILSRRAVAADPRPLVDVHGRVMGITTAIVGRSFRGIGFAIPSNTARRICVEIQENGYVERGHVGLQLREHPGGGVLVVAVAEQSPAALAGLQAGDVVEALGDERIDSPATLVLMLTRLPIGQEVVVTVRREGNVLTVPVRIGRRPRERGQFSLE